MESNAHSGTVVPAPKTKFSESLAIPFTRRTWPSMATAETASRTGAWQLHDPNADCAGQERERSSQADKNATPFSTGVLNEMLAKEKREKSGLTSRITVLNVSVPAAKGGTAVPPAPPPRRAVDGSGVTGNALLNSATPLPSSRDVLATNALTAQSAPWGSTARVQTADPARLANLFGYTLANQEDITSQRLQRVQKSYEGLQDTVSQAAEHIEESLRTDRRKEYGPLADHVALLEALNAFHERACDLHAQLTSVEAVIVQVILRSAIKDWEDTSMSSSQAEGGTPVRSLPPRVRSRLSTPHTFVQLELLLMSARLNGPNEDSSAEVQSSASQEDMTIPFGVLAMAREQWRCVMDRLPVSVAQYYDLVDLIHAWGEGWSRSREFAQTLTAQGAADIQARLSAAVEVVDSSLVLKKVQRILDAQRERTRAKGWLSYEALCTIME